MADKVGDTVNEEFIIAVLQNVEGTKGEMIKIKNFTTQGASSLGDNYTSSVVRVSAEYYVADKEAVVKKETFVVKIPHLSQMFMEMFENLYRKEYYVYKSLLPQVYDLLESQKYFTPRFLHANSSYALAFEDLKAHDYVMADKYKLLDYDHCVSCVTTLARFHAASVLLIEKHPDILDHLAWEFLYSEEKKELNKGYLGTMSQNFVATVESWKIFENFTGRIERFWDTILDDMIQLCKPRKNSFNVLNHGDTWTNNMLFKYDDSGRPVDIKLIDFQVSRYTSPAMELQYFLFTSAGEDVVESRLTDLFDAYVDALNGQLEELGSTLRLTQQELQRELSTSYPYIFVIIYGVLPFIFTDQETVIDFSDYGEESFKLSNDEIYQKAYSAKNYKPMAVRGLRFLERKGFF